MSATKPTTILIAGAGVVGLTVAALLLTGRCADRVRVRLLEARGLPRWDAARTDLRVYALSRSSQRILERLGVWQQVLAARACAYRRMQVWEGSDPHGAATLHFDSADVGEPDLGHIVEDSLLRSLLAEIVESSQHAEIAAGAELESIAIGERKVLVDLHGGGSATGALLIAADGTESRARTLLGLPVASAPYAQTALVTHVRSERPHRDTAWQRFLPGGPLAFLPLADGRSSIVWSQPSHAAERLMSADERSFLAELNDASAGVLGELTEPAERAGFPLQALHAIKYCRARAVLVGDAAHTVHPLAGQGMNLGMLDAACIAAVVERALLAGEDPGDLRVLRRYERERKGDNLQMLLALDALHRAFRLPSWLEPVRRLGMRAVERSPAGKRLLIMKALGLNLRSKKLLRWSQGYGKHRIEPHDTT